MRWKKENDYLAISDTGYRVARFVVGNKIVYRASINSEFIGPPVYDAQLAKQACENHSAARAQSIQATP